LIARDLVRGKGPLQGLAGGLAALPESVDLAYATATDAPFLEPDWIRLLASLIGDHDLAIPCFDGYHHPLAALYRGASVLPAVEALLRQDRLRPVFLMEALRARVVTAAELRSVDPELKTLRNLNSPEDYQAALADAGFQEPESCLHGPPRVLVELFGVPRLKAGASTVFLEATNLGAGLRALATRCPALVGSVLTAESTLHPAYTINVNGDRFTTDPSQPLRAGDRLMLLSVDVGG
jgi:molybdopterin-guanine dinucleotide biosynthesis protein A